MSSTSYPTGGNHRKFSFKAYCIARTAIALADFAKRGNASRHPRDFVLEACDFLETAETAVSRAQACAALRQAIFEDDRTWTAMASDYVQKYGKLAFDQLMETKIMRVEVLKRLFSAKKETAATRQDKLSQLFEMDPSGRVREDAAPPNVKKMRQMGSKEYAGYILGADIWSLQTARKYWEFRTQQLRLAKSRSRNAGHAT